MGKNKLPEGWKEIELGDVCKLSGGFAFKSSDFKDKGIPIVRISNFNNDNVDLSNAVYYPSHSEKEFKDYLLEDEDVLIAMSGATTGKIGIITKNNLPCLLNQRVGRFVIKNKTILSQKYLLFLVKSNTFFRFICKTAFGCAQPNISAKDIESFSFILPPLPTQQKIVSILEKAEKAKEMRKCADALTKDFLKSVFLEMFKEKYPIKEFNELIKEFKFGTSVKSGSDGYPVLGIPNVLGEKVILEKCNNVKLTEKEFNNFSLQINDILFVRTNGNPNYVGRCGIFHLNNSNYVFASYLIRARINLDLLNPFFLKAYLNLPMGRKELLSKCRTTAGQYNINTQGLGSIKILLPPIELQQKFSSIVQEVESMKEQQKHSKEHLDKLFNVLMQSAFKGELTI